MSITVKQFIDEFKSKRIQNTKVDNTIVSEYIKTTLEVKTYIPFQEKRAIVELIVNENTKEIDGVLKNDPISQYVSFVTSMIAVHTTLDLSEDPIGDYDLLSASGLLMPIIETFRDDFNDCDVLLKMALGAKLEENNLGIQVGKFLNGILWRLDDVVDGIGEKLGDIDLQKIFGETFKVEDLAKLSSLLDKFSK